MADTRAKTKASPWQLRVLLRRLPILVHAAMLLAILAATLLLPQSALNEGSLIPRQLVGAGLGAYVIVAVFRITEGSIGFDVLGLRVRGAAAGVILWVLCFAAICIAASVRRDLIP